MKCGGVWPARPLEGPGATVASSRSRLAGAASQRPARRGAQVQALRAASGAGPPRTPIRSTLQARPGPPRRRLACCAAHGCRGAEAAPRRRCGGAAPSAGLLHHGSAFWGPFMWSCERCARPVQGLAVVAREQGVRALFAGLSINYLKVVPSTAIGFTAYDALKQYLDLPQNL